MKIQPVLLCLILMAGSSSLCLAQRHLYFFNYISVQPDQVEAFERSAEKVNDRLKVLDHRRSYYVFSTDDYHYYVVWPLASHSTLDTIYQELEELEEDREYSSARADMRKYSKTEHFFINYSLPELSYSPTDADEYEKNFYRWDWYEIRPGQEMQFEDALKQLQALCRKLNIRHSYSVETGHIGKPGPFYVLDHNAAGPEALARSLAEMEKTTGDAGKKLWLQLDSLATKRYSQTGRFRPDLSYIASEE